MLKQIYICDKCGKKEELSIRPREHKSVSIQITADNKDLCSECMNDLARYMNIKELEWWNAKKEQTAQRDPRQGREVR